MKRLDLTGALALIGIVLVPSTGAFALPGQSLAQFRGWTASRVPLRGLNAATDEMSGLPAFDLLTSDHGIVWHFHAATDGRTVRSEALGVGEGIAEPGTTPIRHDGVGYGFLFFRSLYGDAVASDFLTSQRVASVTDGRSRVSTSFYRGKRFGYEVAAGTITIASRSRVDADLALARKCNAAPDSCNE
jgi:hypothetical protein